MCERWVLKTISFYGIGSLTSKKGTQFFCGEDLPRSNNTVWRAQSRWKVGRLYLSNFPTAQIKLAGRSVGTVWSSESAVEKAIVCFTQTLQFRRNCFTRNEGSSVSYDRQSVNARPQVKLIAVSSAQLVVATDATICSQNINALRIVWKMDE